MTDVIMVDLEGTLSDHDERRDTLLALTASDPKNRSAWKTYYAGLVDDDPRTDVLDATKQWIQRDDIRVIIYSTRFGNKYHHEEHWLKAHGLWDDVELWNRESTQTKIKGPQLVALWAVELRPKVLVDDREEVRDLVSRLEMHTIVLGPEDFP